MPRPKRASWDEIEAVSTDAEQIGKRKTGAILAFGVLGGLGGQIRSIGGSRESLSSSFVVGDKGFEPLTPCASCRCSNQLS